MRAKIIKDCKTTSSKAFKISKMSNLEHFSISKQLSRTRWMPLTPWTSKNYSVSLWPEMQCSLPTLLPLWTTDPPVHIHRRSRWWGRCPTIRPFKCRNTTNRTPPLDLLKSIWASLAACRGLQSSIKRLPGFKIILPSQLHRQALIIKTGKKQR